MLIIGINAFSHDTSAALIKDGMLMFAVEEERLARAKHCRDFPVRSVQTCLKAAGAIMDDVDVVCVSLDTAETVKERFLRHTLNFFPKANSLMLQEMNTVRELLDAENIVREKLNFKKELYFCKHHIAHMASSYYLSKFQDSALYSIDGLGEIESSVIGAAGNVIIKTFDEYSIRYPVTIGLLYAAVTNYLGFIYNCDEGKVMGLAPYGNVETYREVFEDIVRFKDNGMYEFNLDYVTYPFERDTWVSEKFIESCGPRRKPKTELTKRHMDVAAGLQYITERVMVHTANHLYKIAGSKNLCLAGGVALNCVANGKILTETPFENIFVQPAANDAGSAIGAALYYYYTKTSDSRRYPLENSYLGEEFSDEYIERVLRESGLDFTVHDSLYSEAAGYLKDGYIVGWFNGRMEFGPRALGNRSILTAPFPAGMKDILNSRVKHREGFRPFAPSVLWEDRTKYFDNDHESPYMLLTYNVLPHRITEIPAITHVDGTARVQTVTEAENPNYYHLIAAFKELTGTGVILNTSFNVMGQPIVNTPDEAIECFKSTNIDYLVLNARYLVRKQTILRGERG